MPETKPLRVKACVVVGNHCRQLEPALIVSKAEQEKLEPVNRCDQHGCCAAGDVSPATRLARTRLKDFYMEAAKAIISRPATEDSDFAGVSRKESPEVLLKLVSNAGIDIHRPRSCLMTAAHTLTAILVLDVKGR